MDISWQILFSSGGALLLAAVAAHFLKRWGDIRDKRSVIAREKIDKLYAPLMDNIQSCCYPDGFDLDDRYLRVLMESVKDNHMYASSALLDLVGRIERLEHEDKYTGGIKDKKTRRFYNRKEMEFAEKVFDEYETLMEVAGLRSNGNLFKKSRHRFRKLRRDIGDKIFDMKRMIRRKIKKLRSRK